jgi:hypothetical protein
MDTVRSFLLMAGATVLRFLVMYFESAAGLAKVSTSVVRGDDGATFHVIAAGNAETNQLGPRPIEYGGKVNGIELTRTASPIQPF